VSKLIQKNHRYSRQFHWVSVEIIQKQSIGGQVIATYSITDSNDWLATWEDRLDSEREGTLPGGLPTEPSESD